MARSHKLTRRRTERCRQKEREVYGKYKRKAISMIEPFLWEVGGVLLRGELYSASG